MNYKTDFLISGNKEVSFSKIIHFTGSAAIILTLIGTENKE
jgi:hypothetical protein